MANEPMDVPSVLTWAARECDRRSASAFARTRCGELVGLVIARHGTAEDARDAIMAWLDREAPRPAPPLVRRAPKAPVSEVGGEGDRPA